MKIFLMHFILIFYCNLSWGIDIQFCLKCHGTENRIFPKIQGQKRDYLEKQLIDFKYKNRLNDEMNEISSNLSIEEINQLASYISGRDWIFSKISNVNSKDLVQGKKLVEAIGCQNCHGVQLNGQINAPRIAGQNGLYIQNQLLAFKTGQRTNDLGQMSSFAQFLTVENIKLISLYINSL